MPIFRQFKFSIEYALNNEYTALKVIGLIGIIFLITYLYTGLKKCDDQKVYLKKNLRQIILWEFLNMCIFMQSVRGICL